jgi:hypothetical protein
MVYGPNVLLQCKTNLKSEICGNFGPLIEHGLHWIICTILTFISEINIYFKNLYRLEQNYYI